MMTPRYEQPFALRAIAELAEIGAMDPADLTHWVAMSLNIHPDDLADDAELMAMTSQLLDSDADHDAVVERMLVYATEPA